MDVVLTLLVCLLWLGAVMTVTPLRHSLRRMAAEILLGLRYMLWELPLRAITGRGSCDPARVRAMEIECGLRPPPTRRELLAQARLAMNAGHFSIAGVPSEGIRVSYDETVTPDQVAEWSAAWVADQRMRDETETQIGAVYAQLSTARSVPEPIDPATGYPYGQRVTPRRAR